MYIVVTMKKKATRRDFLKSRANAAHESMVQKDNEKPSTTPKQSFTAVAEHAEWKGPSSAHVLQEPGVVCSVPIDRDVNVLQPVEDVNINEHPSDLSFHLSDQFDDIIDPPSPGISLNRHTNSDLSDGCAPVIAPSTTQLVDDSVGSQEQHDVQRTPQASNVTLTVYPDSPSLDSVQDGCTSDGVESNPQDIYLGTSKVTRINHGSTDEVLLSGKKQHQRRKTRASEKTFPAGKKSAFQSTVYNHGKVDSPTCSTQLSSPEEDSDDSYHPTLSPSRSNKRQHDTDDSELSEESQSSQHSSAPKRRKGSTSKVVSETTITAHDAVQPELIDRWGSIRKQLDYVLADSKRLYITHEEGKPSKSNAALSAKMRDVATAMTKYAEQFNDLAVCLDKGTEESDMQCFLAQEEQQQKIVKEAQLKNKEQHDLNDSQLTEQVLDQLHKETYARNESQRQSDSQVKGSIQLLQTENGNTKKVYKCGVCEQTLSSRRMLTDHLQRHTGLSLQCSKCHMKIDSRIRMKAHMDFHAHGPWVCHVCQKVGKKKEFIWHTSFLNHMRSHKIRSHLKCKICPEKFTTKQDYVDHVKNKHVKGQKINCKLCDKKFQTERSLRSHLSAEHKTRNEKGLRQ